MRIPINYGLGACCKAMEFKQTTDYDTFFDLLPPDWQANIFPFWETYKRSTKCYVLLEDDKPIVGGLVFSECPPDMLYAMEEATEWFQKGYLYLGFIYVLEDKRGQNFGSLWLSNLKNALPDQKYWLTIEDIGLHGFYSKNGFTRVKSLFNDNQEEILYFYSKK